MAKEARAAAAADLSPAASEAAAAPDAHSERGKISADDVFSLGELSELRRARAQPPLRWSFARCRPSPLSANAR